MFEDRQDAGRKLASALEKYKDKGVLVLAIPKGGVEVAFQVAKHLRAEMGILISRKLPYPDNPESGFGAIAEDGSLFMIEDALGFLSEVEIEEIIREQKEEIKRRIAVLRNNEPLPQIKGRIVILIDDGIAMGSTMRAAIALCKNKKAEKIVVAVPVTAESTAQAIKRLADEVIVLEKPLFFQAVAQVYKNWYDVSDEEVLEFLKEDRLTK